jgi:hypothetical protein
MCDTNRGEVPGVRAGIVKPELFRELETVGGADLQQKLPTSALARYAGVESEG